MAMDPRWWRQRGEALEQFERGQAQGRCAAAGLGTVVDEMPGVELMPSFQGEAWAGESRARSPSLVRWTCGRDG